MRPAIVSGMVTGEAPISFWPIFFPFSCVTLQEVFAKVNSIGQVFFSFVKCFGQLLRLEAFRKREGVSS